MIENLQNEEWKTIDGFDGMYLISNYGRIKSLKGKEERILKTAMSRGYKQVNLYYNSKHHKYKVHRLVAMYFIPNPNNYPVVNHIDECKTNNHVSNLEWCTVEYNNNYGNRLNKVRKTMKGKTPSNKKKDIIQLTLDGKYIKIWDSIREIQRELNYNNSCISQCCNGKLKSSYGYKWQYAT